MHLVGLCWFLAANLCCGRTLTRTEQRTKAWVIAVSGCRAFHGTAKRCLRLFCFNCLENLLELRLEPIRLIADFDQRTHRARIVQTPLVSSILQPPSCSRPGREIVLRLPRLVGSAIAARLHVPCSSDGTCLAPGAEFRAGRSHLQFVRRKRTVSGRSQPTSRVIVSMISVSSGYPSNRKNGTIPVQSQLSPDRTRRSTEEVAPLSGGVTNPQSKPP